MAAQLLDGKMVAEQQLAAIGEWVAQRLAVQQRAPCLAVILVGDDPASQVYVRHKKRACERVGMTSLAFELAADCSQRTLLNLVAKLNDDPTVDGILVQLPLPMSIDAQQIIKAIAPHKDVDGFHPYNVGCLATKMPTLRPCTPYGVMLLLAHYGIDVAGADAVVIGASNIVGRPMALELLLARATVTVCHRRTSDLAAKVRAADIVVSAMGRAHFLGVDWFKPGAMVIDIGINRLADGRLVGDVCFEQVRQQVAWITPVPGGIGPMTVATLMANTCQAAAGMPLNFKTSPQNER